MGEGLGDKSRYMRGRGVGALTSPKCWVIGKRCCRQSERLVREGALREPPLCRPESPS